MIKIKPAIGMIVLAFTSLILITGSPFQIANNLVESNGHLYIKNIGQKVYAADDDDGRDDRGSGGDNDGESDDGNDGVDDGNGGGDEGSGDGEEMKIDNSGLLIKSKDYKSQEKEICKNHDGEWLINANECKFDDNGDHDSVDFDHTMEEKGLWDDYVADKRPYNPNDVDSDNDGIYDDEELSEEEEERLAEHQQEAYQERKEKTKELCLGNDGTYDGKCEFKDDDGTAEQDQVDFEHSLADRGLWEEYDRNYNGADWEYDEADA